MPKLAPCNHPVLRPSEEISAVNELKYRKNDVGSKAPYSAQMKKNGTGKLNSLRWLLICALYSDTNLNCSSTSTTVCRCIGKTSVSSMTTITLES